MIVGMIALGVVAASLPLGLPYSATPLSNTVLRSLEAHAWGKRNAGLIFRIDGMGTGVSGLYFKSKSSTDVRWLWQRVYFTEHDKIYILSFSDKPSASGKDTDAPKADEICFTVVATRWTSRRLYWRDLDAPATLRANPWLDRKLTGDDSCPLALGHLSSADQGRLVVKWGQEHSLGVASVSLPELRSQR